MQAFPSTLDTLAGVRFPGKLTIYMCVISLAIRGQVAEEAEVEAGATSIEAPPRVRLVPEEEGHEEVAIRMHACTLGTWRGT